MNIFKLLFDKNTKKWLSTVDNKYEEEWGTIVKNFFVQDNISFEKYQLNAKLDGINRLSVYDKSKDLAACTPTFRIYYSSDKLERTLNNDDLGINNWFYIAYPDVAKWAGENYYIIKADLMRQGVLFRPYYPDNLQVLRFIVSIYQKNRKLECSL